MPSFDNVGSPRNRDSRPETQSLSRPFSRPGAPAGDILNAIRGMVRHFDNSAHPLDLTDEISEGEEAEMATLLKASLEVAIGPEVDVMPMVRAKLARRRGQGGRQN